MKKIYLFPYILLVLCMMLISCSPNQTAVKNTPSASEAPTKEASASPTPVITAIPTEEPTEEPEPTEIPTSPTKEMLDEHDYNALRKFLEIEDENGIKNGKRLSASYDPDDPGTWGNYISHRVPSNGPEDEYVIVSRNFTWTLDGHLRRINLWFGADWTEDEIVVGDLDLSGCIGLANVEIAGMNITSLNVSGCYSPIVQVYSCPDLKSIDAGNDVLMELDVRECPKIKELRWVFPDECTGDYTYLWIVEQHYVEEADVAIKADGAGSVGFENIECMEDGHPWCVYTIAATPKERHKFLGWYDTNGNLISKEAEIPVFDDDVVVNRDGKEVSIPPLIKLAGSNKIHIIAKFK